jgi:hypothetical protein
MALKRKHILSVVIGVPLVLLAAAIVYWIFWIDPGYMRVAQLEKQWRTESIAALQAARTTDQLEQAVGRLGVYVPLADGSWIAISYHDTHSGTIASLAIARDSGDNWYESTEHYCGSLRGLTLRIEQEQAQVPMDERSLTEVPCDEGDLCDLYRSADLDEARAFLQQIGFTPFEP